MSSILSDKLSTELQIEYNRITEEKFMSKEVEMAEACIEAMKSPLKVNLVNEINMKTNNHQTDDDDAVCIIENDVNDQGSSQILMTPKPKPALNYAAALKNKTDVASTSKSLVNDDDLISFDDEENHKKQTIVINKCIGDSSPEY